VAIDTCGNGEDDTTCVTTENAAVSGEQQEAAATCQRIHAPTVLQDVHQAYYYSFEGAEPTIDPRIHKEARRFGGLFSRFRLSRIRQALAVTFNAAVAVLAAQHVALMFCGSAAPTSILSGTAISDGVVDIPVPAAAVMRVAPAGASTVTHTSTAGTTASKRSIRFSPETVRTFAGSGAAVTGTLMGGGYLIRREIDNDDEGENDNGVAHREEDAVRCESTERYRRIMSTSCDDTVANNTMAAPTLNASAVSAPVSSTVGQSLSQIQNDSNLPPVAMTTQPASTVVKRKDEANAEVAEKAELINASEDEDEQRAITAKCLVNDREAAKRDFRRMRSLLETRLRLEAAERQAHTTKIETNGTAAEASMRILFDREAAKRDFQRMRSLLEARLSMEAAERERLKLQAPPSNNVEDNVKSINVSDSTVPSQMTGHRDRERFQRVLLAARIRQDAVDKAAFLHRELDKRERAAAIVEELIELHRRREVEEMRANADDTDRKKPTTITPELMSTIQIMQEDKDSVSSSNKALVEAKDTSSTDTVKKRRLRLALASVAAFFASSLTSSE